MYVRRFWVQTLFLLKPRSTSTTIVTIVYYMKLVSYYLTSTLLQGVPLFYFFIYYFMNKSLGEGRLPHSRIWAYQGLFEDVQREF